MVFMACDMIATSPPIIHERTVKSHDWSKEKKKYNKYISPLNKLMRSLYLQKNVAAADAISGLFAIREYLIKVYKLEKYRTKRFAEEGFIPENTFTM